MGAERRRCVDEVAPGGVDDDDWSSSSIANVVSFNIARALYEHNEEERCSTKPEVVFSTTYLPFGGSVAEWLSCWTHAKKGLGSNRSFMQTVHSLLASVLQAAKLVAALTSNKCIAVCKVATPLRELTCHMKSHSVTCHPAEVTFPPCNCRPSGKLWQPTAWRKKTKYRVTSE